MEVQSPKSKVQSRRTALGFWLLAPLLCLLALAQNPVPAPATQNPQSAVRNPQSQRPFTIRTATDLVLVDVKVTDRSGKPVKGLKPEQFSVLEDGKPQEVASFDYYDIEAIETAGEEASQPVVISFTAPPRPEQVRDRRLILLFFDLTSMQPEELLRARDAALRYLREQMTPADLVSVVTFGNRMSVPVGFTNDRALLERLVSRLRPGKDTQLAELAVVSPDDEDTVMEDTGAAFTADETEFNIFNTDRKLAALESLCQLLRDIPGKKSVVHFTGGVTQTGEENRSQLRAAVEAANRANASLYTVDARGLIAVAPGGEARAGAAAGTAMFRGAAVFRQSDARQGSRETLATLAADTGGRSFFDVGDFREVFDKVQKDASGYYLLGYYSTNAAKDGRWRRIRVTMNLPNVRLRSREGYYAPKDYGLFTTEDRERQLDEAMRAENPRVELPLAVETAHFRIGPGEIFVPVAAKLASSALEWAEKRGRKEAEFDFAAEVREAESNRVVGVLRDTIKVRLDAQNFQHALVYQGGVLLGPGNYKLKFLARENETGRIGTFEQALRLPRPQPERLELSSVMLSSQIEAARKTPEVEKKAAGPDARLQRSPLEVAGERIVPNVTRVFTAEQKLYIFFQAYLPPKVDASRLRAGLVFFRGGERLSETPLVEPAEVDAKTRTAYFRISLPLEKFTPGRYTVEAVAVEAGGEYAAFARNYFALRTPQR